MELQVIGEVVACGGWVIEDFILSLVLEKNMTEIH